MRRVERQLSSVLWLTFFMKASLTSTSKSSLSSIHSNPSSELTSSSNSPPNDGVLHSSSNSDTENISGDIKIEDKTDELSEGSPASGGAFNPETGEINWDCPCLGGMAHGPCGPEFREAFSCFVYSEAEPKGINCVEKFQNMQNCFRAHPELYADGKEILFSVLVICRLIFFLQKS